MKIKQLISYPIPNELGLGNTNETYIRIENSLDVSDIFPADIEVPIFDSKTGTRYLVKATTGREFRINQLGKLYRDYDVRPGDEIKFTCIENNGKRTVFFNVTNYKRIFLTVGTKGTEIINLDHLNTFKADILGHKYDIRISEGILELNFKKSEKKRADSPNNTDFYESKVNNIDLSKGNYYITIGDSHNTLEEVKKNLVEEFLLPEEKNSNDDKKIFPLQQIFYGAPGTGKSNKIEEYTNDSNRIRTTFHPDSDYSTFVGAYKPTMEETGVTVAGKKETRIAYKYVPQAFLKAYVNAWNLIEMGADSPYYLVIEEINRGNCAQIFGDLFQLLDRGDNGESKYAICPDDDIKRFLAEEFKNATNIPETIKKGEEMRLPSNLYIWATMNTSDQSLFPIDSAFKRRWDWEYMPIEKGNKELVIEIGANKYDWWKFISIINSKIDEITGCEDKKLGYWFAKPVGDGTIISCNQFVSKVLFYLWNDVYKDYADDNRSIFRIQDGNNTKKVAFTEFFGSERDTKLYAFMKANGIEPEKSSVENTDVDTTEQQ